MSSGNSVDDAGLWQAFQGGSSESLGQLMTRHYDALYYYGTKFSRDTDFLRDCIQDVFVELWQRRRTISSLVTAQVKPYLMTMLRRLVHQEYKRQQQFSFQEPTDSLPDFEIEFSVEDKLIDAEKTQHNIIRINQLLNQLPRRCKEAIYLRFYENLDRPMIAHIMGISEQSVSNLFQEAFRLLRQHMKAEIFWLGLLLTLFH